MSEMHTAMLMHPAGLSQQPTPTLPQFQCPSPFIAKRSEIQCACKGQSIKVQGSPDMTLPRPITTARYRMNMAYSWTTGHKHDIRHILLLYNTLSGNSNIQYTIHTSELTLICHILLTLSLPQQHNELNKTPFATHKCILKRMLKSTVNQAWK